MKAVVMTEPGEPEVLAVRDLPEPAIERPDQIKVELKAAGVNPVDTKLRQRGPIFADGLPAVLGCDGAGVVVETGEAVTRFRPGDEVWFCHGGLGREQGNYAEYTVLTEHEARFKPQSLGFVEAAAAPLVMLTAWEGLYDRARLHEGQTVLIHAGAGGVGHIAIQLACLVGARVATTVGSTDKAAFVGALGADEIIPYRERDFIEAVNAWTDGRGVDVAFDTVGGATLQRTMEAVAHYGDVVTLLGAPEDMDWGEARNRNLRVGFELMLTPMIRDLPEARAHQGEILDRAGEAFDAGDLQIHVGETLPLEQAVDAHRHIEAGHTQGKLVLTM